MRRGLRVLLIADAAAGVQTLRMLAGTVHEVVAVITRGTETAAAGASVAGVASRVGYPVWPDRVTVKPDFADLIRQQRVDLLLNVHARYVLQEDVVTAP